VLGASVVAGGVGLVVGLRLLPRQSVDISPTSDDAEVPT